MKHLFQLNVNYAAVLAFHHRVKCFSGEKMCLTTPNQVVSSSLNSPGFFFTQTLVDRKKERADFRQLVGNVCCGPKFQLHSLQRGKKWIEVPSGPWDGSWACLYPGCKKYCFFEMRK